MLLPAGHPEGEVNTDAVATLFGHDFELFQGTEGAVNPSTAARICAGGLCGWFAGVHVPNGAALRQCACATGSR